MSRRSKRLENTKVVSVAVKPKPWSWKRLGIAAALTAVLVIIVGVPMIAALCGAFNP
jgi:hypothetical protein